MEHPLEKVFNMEKDSTNISVETVIPTTEIIQSGNVMPSQYDNLDQDIHMQADQVYKLALLAYNQQMLLSNSTEAKFANRAAEIGAQYLAVALNAVGEKSKFKQHKDKLKKSEIEMQLEQSVTIDRNELLRNILEATNKVEEKIEKIEKINQE